MKRLIYSLLLGIIVPGTVALMLRYNHENKLAEFSAVTVQVQSAEIQPDKTSTKGLKQLTLQASYVAFGQRYSWNTVLRPLARSQNERALTLVDAVNSKKSVEAWVRKISPEKLILFLPETPLNPLTYFFLIFMGFVLALIALLVGSNLIPRDPLKPAHR
jgi:hypothetical protein